MFFLAVGRSRLWLRPSDETLLLVARPPPPPWWMWEEVEVEGEEEEGEGVTAPGLLPFMVTVSFEEDREEACFTDFLGDDL